MSETCPIILFPRVLFLPRGSTGWWSKPLLNGELRLLRWILARCRVLLFSELLLARATEYRVTLRDGEVPAI